MADTLTAHIEAALSLVFTKDLAIKDVPDKPSLNIALDFTDGTGAGAVNKYLVANYTPAGSGTQDVDLAGGSTDRFGSAITFARLKAIIVESNDASSEGTHLLMGAGSNPIVTPWGTSGDQIRIRAGGFLLLGVGSDDATGYAVTAATADILRFTNEGAGAADFNLGLLGCAA